MGIHIGEEQAKRLDEMLIKCEKEKVGYTQYQETNKDEYEKLCLTASLLSDMGYIKILAQQGADLLILLQDKGKAFIRNDSFVSRIEEKKKQLKLEERKREIEEAEHQLTLKKLRAAKREPYLIAWSIITTITSIILAIIQLTR